ncbi:MAG: flagellin, partial [Synergistaceae bacterium]|nr:flagellin [Synergistaceae bacterium]
MRIMNNLPALNAFRALNSTNRSLQKTINSLSTGLRINSSSDDAAGFAISGRLRAQVGGLDTALRNSQDGMSLLQTAEGALSQTNDMLQRMRDLSVQAGSDSLTSQDRQYIQQE